MRRNRKARRHTEGLKSKSHRVAKARVAVFCCALVTGLLGTQGIASADNEYARTYENRSTPTPAAQVGITPGGHAEADIVYRGTEYVAFYRVTHTNGHLAIYRSTSNSPNSGWSTGQPVIVGGQATGSGAGVALGCGGAYAPSVTIDVWGTLFMVYEANPKVGGTNCETNTQNSNQYVAMAKSTDGGVTWTNFQKLLWYSTSANGANLGTPEIAILPGNQTRVTWHVNPGAAGPGNPLLRQARLWPTGDPNVITPNNGGSVTTLQFLWLNNLQPITSSNGFWASNGGVGRADFTSGPIEGYYYVVLEAFAGVPLCGHPSLQGVTVHIGRSTSPTGPFTVWAGMLDPDGFVPVCNNDMPSLYTDVSTNRGRILFTAGSPNRLDFRQMW